MSTIYNILETVVVVTHCEDDICTLSTATTGYVVVSSEETIYTTYCSLSADQELISTPVSTHAQTTPEPGIELIEFDNEVDVVEFDKKVYDITATTLWAQEKDKVSVVSFESTARVVASYDTNSVVTSTILSYVTVLSGVKNLSMTAEVFEGGSNVNTISFVIAFLGAIALLF